MHPRTERRVQHHPPVPHLVAETLDHQRGVARYMPRCPALLGEVAAQVGDRAGIQPGRVQTCRRLRLTATGHLPQEPAQGTSQLGGAALVVAEPERQAAGAAWRR